MNESLLAVFLWWVLKINLLERTFTYFMLRVDVF
jgi:hypothetical protein